MATSGTFGCSGSTEADSFYDNPIKIQKDYFEDYLSIGKNINSEIQDPFLFSFSKRTDQIKKDSPPQVKPFNIGDNQMQKTKLKQIQGFEKPQIIISRTQKSRSFFEGINFQDSIQKNPDPLRQMRQRNLLNNSVVQTQVQKTPFSPSQLGLPSTSPQQSKNSYMLVRSCNGAQKYLNFETQTSQRIKCEPQMRLYNLGYLHTNTAQNKSPYLSKKYDMPEIFNINNYNYSKNYGQSFEKSKSLYRKRAF